MRTKKKTNEGREGNKDLPWPTSVGLFVSEVNQRSVFREEIGQSKHQIELNKKDERQGRDEDARDPAKENRCHGTDRARVTNIRPDE